MKDKKLVKKKISSSNLARRCAVCGKKMHIILYDDRTYRGGHFFGKIPLHRKKEIQKAMQSGTRRVKFGKLVMNVLKVDPKVYAYAEYWECEKCYS